jgi:hypothetical protein
MRTTLLNWIELASYPSNENKMSDGGRGRALLGVKMVKSHQKWRAQRSAVRSIAWLDRLRDTFNEFLCPPQRPFLPTEKYVFDPVFVGPKFLPILEFADKQRAKSAPICVLAALEILLRSENVFFERLDAIENGLSLRVACFGRHDFCGLTRKISHGRVSSQTR